MVLGLLPSIRGGLGELAKSGQHSRFIQGYLKPYARIFEEVRYFSYLHESLYDYTNDAELLAKARLFPGGGWHPWLYAFFMPFRYSHQFRSCTVLRVFQITGVIPALVAKRLFGIPFVTTYGFWYSQLARSRTTGWLHRRVAAAGLAAADAVIVTTPELKADVVARVGVSKVHLIPNGVNTELFRPAAPTSRPVKNVLYIGRFSEEKNLAALVTAAAKLASRFPLRLTFIGAGSLRAELGARAAALGVAAEFVGVVDHRNLPARYRQADAFVLPSFTEGHPKVLIEAMASGLPCVVSDCAGNRALVRDGETGLLFDPRNPDVLAAALERVLGDEPLAAALGRRAREVIVREYDLAVLVEREIRVLKQIAQKGSR